MFLQSLVNSIDEARRKTSDNLTIGGMLDKLSQFATTAMIEIDDNGMAEYKAYIECLCHDEPEVVNQYIADGDFDKVYLCDDWSSYRGYYADMRIGTTNTPTQFTVAQLIDLLNRAKDKGEMYGYKGGDYSVNDETLCWLEREDNSCSGIMPIGFYEVDAENVLLLTKCENECGGET